jgi:hypothetical protein
MKAALFSFLLLGFICGCSAPRSGIGVMTNAAPAPPSPDQNISFTARSDAPRSAMHVLAAVVPLPPPDYTTNIEVSWDEPDYFNPNVWFARIPMDGYALYLGPGSRSYTVRLVETDTHMVFSWDTRHQLFYAVAAFLNIPQVIYHTNHFTNWFTTNAVTEGPLSDELFFMPPDAPPFGAVSNGMFTLTGYNAPGTNYTVEAAMMPDMSDVEPVAMIAGSDSTNSIWTYPEPATNGQRFFQTLTLAVMTNATD